MYPDDLLANWRSGRESWSDVSNEDWNNWKWQMSNSIRNLKHLQSLIDLTEDEKEGCELAHTKLSLSITPYYFNLIDRNDVNCPMRKQVIPSVNEAIISPEEMLDPVGEEKTNPVKGIVHRYPDRILFLVTSVCASYCRYCTRSRLVSNAQGYDFRPELESGLNYIQQHSEIRDVLISGGDPLLLSDEKLDYLIKRLREIKHVEFVRIGSRVPVFLPQRITPNLCQIFKKYGPIWLSIHVNHPIECTKELKNACEQLICSNVVIGNQSVLLKGINDEVITLTSLSHRLLQMGVRPYYLYSCDLITGSSHFRVGIKKAIDIIKKMRGYTSGYAIPQLVIDAPGGGGKIPINPDYIEKFTNDRVFLKNYKGDVYSYPID